MERRDFLKLTGLGALPVFAGALFPRGLMVWAHPQSRLHGARAAGHPSGDEPAGAASSSWSRVLVLIELAGGNDGLNTVVPCGDDAYYRSRPSLAIPKGELILLDGGALGLHPALAPIADVWQAQELAIVLGVGYANPNRSHFRSIEIWETGSDSDVVLEAGWLAELLKQSSAPRTALAAESITLGPKGDTGAMSGLHMRNLVMQDPAAFIAEAKRLQPRQLETRENPALAHLVRVREEIRAAASRIEERLAATPRLATEFPKNGLGRQLETAARLIASGVPVAIIKATLTGFDTHTQQAGQHQRLLAELAAAVAAFRAALIATGDWSRALVMTYSEFGRRVAENGARGTDHGTAAPHFFAGGAVRGGLYGRQPELAALAGGDLIHTTDYRRLYRTVAAEWWQIADPGAGLAAHEPLGCIRSDSARAASAPRRESF